MCLMKKGQDEEEGGKTKLRWRVTLPVKCFIIIIIIVILPVSMTTSALTGRAYGAALPAGGNNV